MSELISTQELVAKIVDTAIRKISSGEQKLTKEYEQSVKDAVNAILNTARRTEQPEIVRCKDCKHRGSYWGNCRLLEEKYHQSVLVDDDGFCSLAERRTND